MFDIDAIVQAAEKIKKASETTNDLCDDVMDLFKTLKALFDKWGVGVTADHQNEDGRYLEYRRYGKDDQFQFTVLRPESESRVTVHHLKRHEKLDIIHQLPGLMHNIHKALIEQRTTTNTVGDLVSRLELLLDTDASA